MIQSLFLSAARATLLAITAAAMLTAGCSSRPPIDSSLDSALLSSQKQNQAVLNQYKIELARRITQASASTTSTGRLQPMLRSVVVLAFKIDKQGKLITSSVYRTNGDKYAEKIALASLQQADPLPSPPAALIGNNGEVEILEGWLFSDDGHFQLHSIAAPQKRYSLR